MKDFFITTINLDEIETSKMLHTNSLMREIIRCEGKNEEIYT